MMTAVDDSFTAPGKVSCGSGHFLPKFGADFPASHA
jgi:hypothetical protein